VRGRPDSAKELCVSRLVEKRKGNKIPRYTETKRRRLELGEIKGQADSESGREDDGRGVQCVTSSAPKEVASKCRTETEKIGTYNDVARRGKGTQNGSFHRGKTLDGKKTKIYTSWEAKGPASCVQGIAGEKAGCQVTLRGRDGR